MDIQPIERLASHGPRTVSSNLPAPPTGADPMMCSLYLLSPLETILESLDDHDLEYISFHDIMEAYSNLSMRIRSQAHVILRLDQPLLALVPIREHAASLARALKRDIHRALVDPSSRGQKSPSSFESYCTEVQMMDHEIQHSRDVSTLCHHSLRVLSIMFAFETLYSLFSVRDLEDLLSELMKIALSSMLPTPNANKTWSLVFWTIQSQNLPSAILSTRKTEVITALRQALNGEKGLQAKLDGLKAIQTLLKRQPELFVSSLSGFLPTILASLTWEDAGSRIQAAHALSGLTLAKLRMLTSSEFPHKATSKAVHAFIKAQTSPTEPSQGEVRLPSLLSQAFASSRDKAPFWAIVVPACMIVLSDHLLFLRQSLKFCVNSLRPASIHKRADIQALHAPVWRTLVWAFSRLPTDLTWLQPEDANIPDEKIGVRGKAFRMLQQELRSGKGVALAGALLCSCSGPGAEAASVGNVSRALLIVKAMIARERQSDPRDGILLLHRLVSAIGTPQSRTGKEGEQWDDGVNPVLGLFDGTLLEANPDRTRDLVRSLTEVNFNHIRELSEEELVQHWDGLMTAWVDAVEWSLQVHSPQFSRELLDIWQSLLLVKTNLTQEHGHLTASTSFASQIASIVKGFFIQSAEADTQVRRIVTVTKLWGVMKNVYSMSWLPAESILAAALKVKFSLQEEAVRSAWSQLCADLISVGIPTLLHVIFTRSEREEGREVTRLLWTVLARAWQNADDKVHWDELASFLVIPFKAWVMTDNELELWEGTLKTAVSLATSASLGPASPIDRILQRMSEKELDALVLFPKGLHAILAHVDLTRFSVPPTELFTVVDRSLIINYPPQPEMLATCLDILHLLAQIISSAPAAQLVPLLCALEKGICCWIGDEKTAMLETEHNVVVERLYCGTLNLLRKLPRSLETLVAVSPFLTSAFGRLTPSAMGPLAFNEFWRATYHRYEEYRTGYPDGLRACLLGFADAYGGSIAEDLSYETQVTGMSTIPDSQPPYHGPDYSRIYGLGIEGPSLSPTRHRSPTTTPEIYTSPESPAKQGRPGPLTAFEQLQDYSSPQDDDASGSKNIDLADPEHSALLQPLRSAVPSQEVTSESPFGLSTPRPTPQVAADERPPSPGRKRVLPHISERRSKKRRKTDPDQDSFAVLQDMQRRHSENRMPGSSLVQPSSSVEPFAVALESVSQNTNARKRKRVIDWVSMSMNIQNSIPRGAVCQPSRSGPSTPKCLSTRASTPPSAEYDSWEVGASMEEIMQFQRELVGSDHIVPETDIEELDDTGCTEPASEVEDDNILLSPSLRLDRGPEHYHQRRSQTAPVASPQRHLDRPTPLRRNQTTSAKLNALERAYTAMTNDASQIPVADLVQATGLVNRIQTALHEQLTRRLARPPPGDNA